MASKKRLDISYDLEMVALLREKNKDREQLLKEHTEIRDRIVKINDRRREIAEEMTMLQNTRDRLERERVYLVDQENDLFNEIQCLDCEIMSIQDKIKKGKPE